MEPELDIVIVGAGIAGAALACVLGRAGFRTALIDLKATVAPCFKAEKIEPDQAELFRKLGLLDIVTPHAARIREVTSARAGRALFTTPIEQYGIFYQDLVNALRAALPANTPLIIGRVDELETSADRQRVTLDDGRTLECRLVVLASGTTQSIAKRLRLEKRMISADHSLCFGFTVGGKRSFDSLTYYSDDPSQRYDYLTLFPIGDIVRANFFAYLHPKDAWVRAFSREPRAGLLRLMPGLFELMPDLEVISKVDIRAIDLYVVEGGEQAGAVLVGDAYQSVCPTTGTGLTKVLVDLDVLAHDCIPKWLATPGMSAEKIAEYYRAPKKVASDRRSLDLAAYQRSLATEEAMRWRLRRWKTFTEMAVRGWLSA